MDEAKRFLRYVIPGIVFIIEVIIYLFVSDPALLKEYINASGVTTSSEGIGLIIVAFMSTGGLGYIFSNVYYFIYNRCDSLVVDHRDLLIYAEKESWIKLSDRNCKELSAHDAWQIVTALWKSRLKSSIEIESTDLRMDSLADILHGLGTSCIASMFALIFWFFIDTKRLTVARCTSAEIVVSIIGIFIILVLFFNYKKTRLDVQNIVSIILSEELRRRYERYTKGSGTHIIKYK